MYIVKLSCKARVQLYMIMTSDYIRAMAAFMTSDESTSVIRHGTSDDPPHTVQDRSGSEEHHQQQIPSEARRQARSWRAVNG